MTDIIARGFNHGSSPRFCRLNVNSIHQIPCLVDTGCRLDPTILIPRTNSDNLGIDQGFILTTGRQRFTGRGFWREGNDTSTITAAKTKSNKYLPNHGFHPWLLRSSTPFGVGTNDIWEISNRTNIHSALFRP